MKTTTTMLALCVCLVGAMGAFAENIISNGSFEVGYLHWADNWNGTVGTSMIRTNSAAEEGIWSMACKGGIDDWANVLQVYPGDLSGLTVRVTCWVMSPSSDSAVARLPGSYNNCSVILKFQKPDSAEPINEVYGMKDVSAGGARDQWICLTNQVDSFPADMTNFSVVLYGLMSSGLVYYDNVILEVLPKVPVQNIISNGSFEVGYLHWADNWNGTVGTSMIRTNSAAEEGIWSEACKGGIDDWANVWQVYPGDLSGLTVRVTCWVMSPSSDSAVARLPGSYNNCSVILKLEKPGTTAAINEVYGMKDVSAGGVRDQWICLTNQVDSFPADMTNFKVVLLGINSAGLIYYDNVILEVLPKVLVQNGSFENGWQAYADGWNGTIPSPMMRTNSAAYDGEWSEACLGGVLPNANVFQRCPDDLAGQYVLATCWVMSPSSDSAVALNPDMYNSCSAIFKLEQPDSYDPIGDPTYGMPDVNVGGVRDQWFCLTNEIPSFPEGMTNFKIICMATLSNGVIYFDKVALDIIPEPVLLSAGALSLLLLFWKKRTT